AADADVEAKDRFGFTALHRAGLSHDAGAAHMLLDRGADITVETTPEHPNEADKHGQTPFHVSIGSGNLAMAKLLISRGFDLSRFTLDQVTYYKPFDRKTLREIDQVVGEGRRKQVKIHTVAELFVGT